MEDVVYLDTHAVVWLYAGELSLFPQKVLHLIEKADIKISPVIQLELQYLLEIERIKVKPEKIIASLRDSIGLKICGLEFNKVILEAIKQDWTRDPFDRLIVAQANLVGAPLVTKDQSILKQYKKAVWQ